VKQGRLSLKPSKCKIALGPSTAG